jgi:hypothetical protein
MQNGVEKVTHMVYQPVSASLCYGTQMPVSKVHCKGHDLRTFWHIALVHFGRKCVITIFIGWGMHLRSSISEESSSGDQSLSPFFSFLFVALRGDWRGSRPGPLNPRGPQLGKRIRCGGGGSRALSLEAPLEVGP